MTASPSFPSTRSTVPTRTRALEFWVIAVAMEVVLALLFLFSGAADAIDVGLDRAGLDFGSDLVTALRVVAAYPPALLGVVLALAQVGAPDLAVAALAARRGGRTLLLAVRSRLRPWSPGVGARRGLAVWCAMVLAFTAANIVSGLLHRALVPGDFSWHLGAGTLALLPVAMFLDAGALLEENGWRGFALPALLDRYGPVTASVLLGLAWATWHYPVKYDAFTEYGLAGGTAYLGAFTIKIVALTVVMTWFWARAGQSTLLAIAMHGLSNDVARVGGLVEGSTWRTATISELDLALPFVVLVVVLVTVARRTGWGDLRGLGAAPPQPPLRTAGAGRGRR